MNYEIIKDKEMSVNALINSAKTGTSLYSESEINSIKKSPWTNFLLTEEYFFKEKPFYMDAGFIAFSTVVTLDNTLTNALKSKFLEDLTFEDVNIEKKITNLNLLSDFLDLKYNKIEHSDFKTSFYNCKMAGFTIMNECYKKLLDESNPLEITVSEKTKRNYGDIINYLGAFWTEAAFIKGSYVDYVESRGKTKFPGDIDLGMLTDVSREDYYEIITMCLESSKGTKIPIVPIIIPYSSKNSHSFFDLDINSSTKFLSTYHSNETLQIRKNPQIILQSYGNSSLKKIRSLLSSEERIQEACTSYISSCKVHSILRKPEMFFKHLSLHMPEIEVPEPSYLSDKFDRRLSIEAIQSLLAEASLEMSEMNRAFENYAENRN